MSTVQGMAFTRCAVMIDGRAMEAGTNPVALGILIYLLF